MNTDMQELIDSWQSLDPVSRGWINWIRFREMHRNVYFPVTAAAITAVTAAIFMLTQSVIAASLSGMLVGVYAVLAHRPSH
jgi:hypothetical protein